MKKSWFLYMKHWKADDMQRAWSFTSWTFLFLCCLLYCLMCLLSLCHSFYEQDFKLETKSTENNKKQQRAWRNTCMKHEIQKQSLHNQKIKKLSELLKHWALLQNHFIILFYHQSDVQKASFLKRNFVLFCIQDLDDLTLRHCMRQYCKMNIRQVFFYETELQEIVSLQFYH